MEQPEPTISSILLDLAHEYTGVVAEREVLDRVLERRPSQAKDPYASIRNKLRYEAVDVGWLRLGNGEMMPRRIALQDLRFRVIPTPQDFASGMIARYQLSPFVSMSVQDPLVEDVNGRPFHPRKSNLPSRDGSVHIPDPNAQTLDEWYASNNFVPGDSILVTIRQAEPLLLRFEREPAAAFRAEEVIAQDREVVEALAIQVARNRSNLLFPDDVVLPVYARAAWRMSYPGRSWLHLVEDDPRMRVVDRMYLADSSFRRPQDMLYGTEQEVQFLVQQDQELLKEIEAFQVEMLASRRDAAERGVWNGVAPRASTGRVIFDMREGTSQVIHRGTVDALIDHTSTIEQRVERGDYEGEDWDDAFDTDDIDDMELEADFEGDEELYGIEDIEDIEDMQAFAEQNPELIEATQKLMASLSPSEVAELNAAETPDQVQRILTSHLNTLLGREPALFAELTPKLPVPSAENGNGNGHSNGNGNGNGHGPNHDELLAIEEDDLWLNESEREEWEDGDEEDDDEEGEDDDADVEAVNEVIERSNQWMERFYQSLIAQGKSDSTAASRTGDLWIYADFLSSYYNRGLEEGDYATLDECLFFFYPRKVINNSPRAAREICTSVKQFYTFLRAEGVIKDDSFAHAIWRRRDQAAHAIELYDRIDGESPQFERLFAHLFAPYTA